METRLRTSRPNPTRTRPLFPLLLVAASLLYGDSLHALPIGRLKSLKPVVEIRADKAKKWSTTQERQSLAFGDTIRTGPSGKADLLFNNGTQVAMRSKCQLRLEAPASVNKPLVIRVFGALSEVFVRAKGNTEIRTAAGTAAVRGTEYLVSLPSEDSTVVTVIEGSVAFYNPQGSVVVAANQQSTARVGEAPTPPVAVDVSGLIEWSADITGLPIEFETPSAPGEAASGIDRALASLSARDPQAARQALEGIPDSGLVSAVRGLIAIHEGNLTQATIDLQSAIAQDPKLYQAHALLALCYLNQNQLPQAEQSARRAVELQPDSAQAQGTLAMVLFFEKKPKEATVAAKRAVQLNPLSPFALLTQGRVLLSQQKTDAALSAFQQAAALAPDLPIFQTELGAAYLRLDQPKKAEASYRNALKGNPDSPDAHTGLGLALQQQGQEREAEAEHRTALQLDANSAAAHGNLATLYIEQGKFKEAQQELEQGVKDRPEKGLLYIRLSEISLYRQNLSAAQEFALKAVQLLPGSAPAHYQLGRVYLEQQRLFQAEQEFRQAVTLDRKLAAARYALGLVREKTGGGLLASAPSLMDPSSLGTPSSPQTIENMQTPGAEDRIQAAIQDPTVLRTATRSYGDTELAGLWGEDNTHDFALSHLSLCDDKRAVWGASIERQDTDGVRANADETFDSASVVYGTKEGDSPSAFFLLAEYEHMDEGVDDLFSSSLRTAGERQTDFLPRIILGYSDQNSHNRRTSYLLQGSRRTLDLWDTRTTRRSSSVDYDSLNGEIRHEFAFGESEWVTLGLSIGTRVRTIDDLLPVTPIVSVQSNGDVHAKALQAYFRDEAQLNPRLSLTGELRVQKLNYSTATKTTIVPPAKPPTTTEGDDTPLVGLPKLLLTYHPSGRSGLRLRARRLAGTIADFQLLNPPDDFLFSFDDLPHEIWTFPLSTSNSLDMEYYYTFSNASSLRIGLLHEKVKDADPFGQLPKATVQSLRAAYEGMLGRDTSYFLRTDFNRARGDVRDAGGVPLPGDNVETVPDFVWATGIQYLNPEGFFLQSVWIYQSERERSFADPTPLASVSLLNLRVGKRHGLRSSFYVELNNVFDEKYEIPNIMDNELQPGREWRVGGSWRF